MIKTEDKYLIYDRPIKINIISVIKSIFFKYKSIYYKNILNIFHPKYDRKTKYKVCICAIFRDEALYLKEWITYHKIIGVEHFYLYNNFSEDNYLEILKPYITKNEVTLIDWNIPQGQMAAYEHCVKNFSSDTKWLGFIDLDEFVVLNKDNNIDIFLEKFKYRPMVLFYWKYFGSSGIKERDTNGLVVEDFVVCWRKHANIGKLFFNTAYQYYPQYNKNEHMHYMWANYKGKALPPVNIFDNVCINNITHTISSEVFPAQINHYLIKSYSEYITKKAKRGGGVHKDEFHTLDYFYKHDIKRQSTDYSIYKYLIQLKIDLER